jgi:2-keto-4-pentenoate hydratase/2-oxohepta-3-ene-1,7-dioic acid hydratase in catechol pathway
MTAWFVETVEHDGRAVLALAVTGGHVPVAAAGIAEPTFAQLIAHWDLRWPALQALAERAAGSSTLIRGARPIEQLHGARKLVCAGANYYKHLAEMNVSFTKLPGAAPFFFLKPLTALVGPGRTLPLDPAIHMLDWEVELVAVIGRGGRDIPVARALDHVAGYTVAVDVTARDRLFNPESIFKFDFLAGKGRDGYCPIATGVVPAALVGDPQDLALRLAVNGVTKQDARTSDMIFSVAELVAWASKTMTLEPGDLLLTGSPEGVGMPRREFLRAGDVIKVELPPLPAFEVEVFAAEAG